MTGTRALPFLIQVESGEDGWDATASIGEWVVWRESLGWPRYDDKASLLDMAEEAFGAAMGRALGYREGDDG